MFKILNAIVTTLLLLFLFAVVTGIYLFSKYSHNLPSYEQLKSYNPAITTRLYAADGELFAQYAKENRVFVPIEIIPKHLINAFLAAEDSNFYRHSGVDPFAILRTAIDDIAALFRGESIVGGASTITQQVVKNFLLSNEKTLERKIKEAILAFRITKALSKDKILELYLNQIYLGNGAYGVGAAAQTYFDKSVDELEIEEVALLATMPKAPSKLDPYKNVEKAQERRDWVIDRMLSERFITRDEAAFAKSKPIALRKVNKNLAAKADAFSDSVKKELTNLYGSDNVFESGIVVQTTLQPSLQKIAEAALQKGLERYDMEHGYRGVLGKIDLGKDSKNWLDNLQKFEFNQLYKDNWGKAVVLNYNDNIVNIGIDDGTEGIIGLADLAWARKYINVNAISALIKKPSDVLKIGDVILVEKIADNKYALRQIPEVNGGLIAMDPHTGRILAMMGGYIDAANQFNRAIQAKRQSGSVLKTFGYLTALENGLTPATIIMDEEVTLDQGGSLLPYKPSNYSNEFYGPVTLRQGLEKSLNVTTVRIADQVGLDKVAQTVARFGINENPTPIYSLVLGSAESTLTKLVNAYAMIVNGGKKVSPALIEKIQDRSGKTIYKRDQRDCRNCIITETEEIVKNKIIFPMLYDDRQQITDPQTAYQITSMLEGAVQRGTGAKAAVVGKIIGGKTGTTNNSYDSWFIGFSPDLIVGVYVGFDIPKSLGITETGASVALPIFIDFMKEALKNVPSTPFRVPNGIKFVKIDRNTGRYPTASTPKNKIMFEALKINDYIGDAAETVEINQDEGQDDLGIEKNVGGIY